MSKIVIITSYVYDVLKNTVGKFPPETGAIIGSGITTISQVWFDEQAGIGQKYYRPTNIRVDEIVRQWMDKGYSFAGIVHSHVDGYPKLSPMDIRSAAIIMEANQMRSMLLGLFYEGHLSLYEVSGIDHEKPEVKQLEFVVV